jgi:hypothetical protein
MQNSKQTEECMKNVVKYVTIGIPITTLTTCFLSIKKNKL